MKYYKSPSFVTLSILVICIVLQPIFYKTINLLYTINLTFLFSATFLFVGFFLAMVAMGTFDSTQFLLKKLFKRRSATSTSKFDQPETTNYWSQKVGKTYLFPLNVGFSLFILCMVFLAVYYLF
ncbi:DUF3899 domain-containing protein [Desemzia sp. RIT804]|uniref:DUF3899 domain-containing protein n=1 Tax=Desemzia sp. RIT 804 TaxID=2810209 RepID=UPI00194F73F7|nr:DUF3899 domain-containing protein [Desemzia sp. RIT 804]MBM6613456.1 DUF3899 domain-containing protein [Desemzia sp. RIT 804]